MVRADETEVTWVWVIEQTFLLVLAWGRSQRCPISQQCKITARGNILGSDATCLASFSTSCETPLRFDMIAGGSELGERSCRLTRSLAGREEEAEVQGAQEYVCSLAEQTAETRLRVLAAHGLSSLRTLFHRARDNARNSGYAQSGIRSKTSRPTR